MKREEEKKLVGNGTKFIDYFCMYADGYVTMETAIVNGEPTEEMEEKAIGYFDNMEDVKKYVVDVKTDIKNMDSREIMNALVESKELGKILNYPTMQEFGFVILTIVDVMDSFDETFIYGIG